jgi:hypothetical protein
MTKDEIIEAIKLLNNSKECSEIVTAAKERAKSIREAEYDRQIKDYWSRAIFYREGQTLFCNTTGTFLGGPMQRGDKCKVLRMDIDQKKPLIWVTVKGRSYGFPPSEAFRYRLLPTKPEKPISQLDRQMGNMIGEMFDKSK